jgi:arylsulfatase A-like enzyme
MRLNNVERWVYAAIAIAATYLIVALAGFADDGSVPARVETKAVEARRPPNILMIIADDLGVDQVGAYGEGANPARTPNIDALAARGVLFRNTWSNPVCSSTRATILTGRYGFRTGVGFVARPGADLETREHTLPELLARHPHAPYGTAAFGKWHLNAGPDPRTGRRHLAAPIWAGFSHFQGVFQNIRRGYSYWGDLKVVLADDGKVKVHGPTLNTQYNTSEIVNYTGEWIRNFETRRPDAPWFVWLAFNAAHTPFHKPPPSLHSVDLSDPSITCRNPPPFAHPENLLPCYQAMVEAMDREIGRLLAREISPESLSRTTVIFLGDNGTIKEAAPDRFLASRGKGTPYEGGVNVPLVIAGAGVPESASVSGGRESQVLVNTTDLFATVLELAGLDVAASVPSGYARPRSARAMAGLEASQVDPEVVLDSYSLLPFLADPKRDTGAEARRFAYTELFKQGFADPRFPVARAIRNTRGYKLIHFDETRGGRGGDELYDLAADPFERTNLIGPDINKESAAARVALQVQLDAMVESGWRPHGSRGMR